MEKLPKQKRWRSWKEFSRVRVVRRLLTEAILAAEDVVESGHEMPFSPFFVIDPRFQWRYARKVYAEIALENAMEIADGSRDGLARLERCNQAMRNTKNIPRAELLD